MKRCPTCSRVYADDAMRYCLDDGTGLLDESAFKESPETLRIPPPRSTRPARTELLPEKETSQRRAELKAAPRSRTKIRLAAIVLVCIPIVLLIIMTVWAKTFGGSELLYQARHNNVTRMRILIFIGADVNAKDEEGSTALMGTSWRGFRDAVRLLIDKGADAGIRNMKGETALIMAAKGRDSDILKLLVDKSPDINARDDNGWNSLMWTAWEGRTDSARVLINRGAVTSAKNNRGETAMDLAYKRGNLQITDLLD